jgi:hypothetical protein
MTKLRLLAAFLILVTAGAARAAEKGTPSAAPAAPRVAASTPAPASTTPAFAPLQGEIPAPFFAAKASCFVEKQCCDGSTVSCTGSICRVGPNKVVCDNIPTFCPICP